MIDTDDLLLKSKVTNFIIMSVIEGKRLDSGMAHNKSTIAQEHQPGFDTIMIGNLLYCFLLSYGTGLTCGSHSVEPGPVRGCHGPMVKFLVRVREAARGFGSAEPPFLARMLYNFMEIQLMFQATKI
jgi:hypothetical protein